MEWWRWTKYNGRIASEAPFRTTTRMRHGLPRLMLYFGRAPGDDLICTALIRELSKRGQRGIWMMSNHPELFAGNLDVEHIVPVEGRYERFAHVFKLNYRYLEYAGFDAAADRMTSPARHAIAELCVRMGIDGDIDLRPVMHLTDSERAAAEWAKGKVCIQSSGLAARVPMLNKQWPAERYQQTVDALRGEFDFIQLGGATDPKLEGATDLRGKTDKRETAAVLAASRLYVGNAGFLMHVARAVECPSVIVYGGREAPWQTGYGCNLNLYSAEPCAPCWRMNGCDFDRVCMSRIDTGQVTAAIRTLSATPRHPLAVDVITLGKIPNEA